MGDNTVMTPSPRKEPGVYYIHQKCVDLTKGLGLNMLRIAIIIY